MLALLATTTVLLYQAALAFPDGAPWGAANPENATNCAVCHFEAEAERDSAALAVEGLPQSLSPDTVYKLLVTFGNPGGAAAGFQMIAAAGDNSPGTFLTEAENTEVAGAGVRSTAPIIEEGPVSWAVDWRSPKIIAATIKLYVAASAANHDQSPFGDTIHFRTYQIPVSAGAENAE